MGAAALLAETTTREETNPQATNVGLPPLKEVANEEQKEETKESVTTEAMDIEKNLDGAHHGASLASNSDDEDTTRLSKKDHAPEEAAPPCHQSMPDRVLDDPKTARDGDLDEIVEETATIVPSVSDIALKEYQMKLSVPKKNADDYLIRIIRRMMMNDWSMGINVYDPLSTSENPDINPEIEAFDDLPKTTEEREHYFRPIQDKRNKTGTSIVFRIMTEYSHVEWRKFLDEEAKEEKLYVGIHKLESIETEIIGFIAQKLPEMTHLNRFETALMTKLPKGIPKLVVERIFPKTTNGFETSVKTDVLAIRVCKTDAKVVDKALAKLLPPKPEGEYYVSYSGLDDELKRKVYNHQNWYKKKVEIFPVSGFNNIDRQYEIGMNKTWSLRDFIREQPTCSMTVPIDVENGGFKVKGTKILVLPKYKKEAQRTYEEFRKMTKQNKDDAFDVEMHEDDATAVNRNTRGNENQLQAMFDHEQFPDLTEPEKSDNSLSSTNAGRKGSTAQANGKKSKQSKTKSSISSSLDKKKRARESSTRSSKMRANTTSPARSYSSVAGGATGSSSNGTKPNQRQSEKTELEEMKEMIQRLLTLTTQTQMESAVYRREATSSANMVQRLVTNNRALSEQVSLLHSAVETLSRASSCDSTLTSVTDTLEKAKKLRAANPPPIPAEVITKTVHGTDGDKKEPTPETTNTTPDKPIAKTVVDVKGSDAKVAASTANENATPEITTDGFMTPPKKHVASSAASTTSTMEGIETSNAYESLSLQSLGSTRGRTSSPEKEQSPSKRMRKRPKKNAAFMAALNEQFAQADELGLNEKRPSKVDASVTLFGRMANVAATITGYKNDEEIQDNYVTGAANNQWQNAWGEEADSDSEK